MCFVVFLFFFVICFIYSSRLSFLRVSLCFCLILVSRSNAIVRAIFQQWGGRQSASQLAVTCRLRRQRGITVAYRSAKG